MAGDMDEAALDSAQFRARQGAATDEAKETKKGQYAIYRETPTARKETHKAAMGVTKNMRNL